MCRTQEPWERFDDLERLEHERRLRFERERRLEDMNEDDFPERWDDEYYD